MTEQVQVEFKKQPTAWNKIIPFFLTIGVVIADQITKMLVVSNIPLYTVKTSFFGDFLRIVHVRNLGAAFSLGASFSQSARAIALLFMPLIVLIVVVVIYFRNKDFSGFQRWMICGVVGGGFGNLIDRFFRPAGVVDFIDVKFYGIFGFQRFPTFNVADSFITVCGILLVISFLHSMKKESKGDKK